MSDSPSKILYCRCAFAQVVPEGTKNAVLDDLCESNATFECVPDLCEMAARKDARLADLANLSGDVKIVACYPRAVKWLFHQSGNPLPNEGVEILNMREKTAEEISKPLELK